MRRDKKVRLGIVGCGVIGNHHLRAAARSHLIETVAVADLIEERRVRAANDFGVPKAYRQGNQLIADPEIEAVVLAVPAGDRIRMPRLALERGKHVLIEKPVAMNARQLQSYIDLQGDRVAACCSSRFQTFASTQAAAGIVKSGVLGAIRSVSCRVIVPAGPPPQSLPPDWRLKRRRNAGGILCNWGCYDLDYLMAVTGWQLQPVEVLAQTWGVPEPFKEQIAPGSDAESHYAAFIRCEGGAVISLERGEYVASAGEAIWRIIGELGTLRLMMCRGQEELWLDRADRENGIASEPFWKEPDDWSQVHAGPIEDFAEAILEGREPRTGLQRAMLIQTITDGIYASASRGRAVRVSASWSRL